MYKWITIYTIIIGMRLFKKCNVYRVVFPTDQSIQWTNDGNRWKLVHKEYATVFNSKIKAWAKAKEMYNNYYNKEELIRRGFAIRKDQIKKKIF